MACCLDSIRAGFTPWLEPAGSKLVAWPSWSGAAGCPPLPIDSQTWTPCMAPAPPRRASGVGRRSHRRPSRGQPRCGWEGPASRATSSCNPTRVRKILPPLACQFPPRLAESSINMTQQHKQNNMRRDSARDVDSANRCSKRLKCVVKGHVEWQPCLHLQSKRDGIKVAHAQTHVQLVDIYMQQQNVEPLCGPEAPACGGLRRWASRQWSTKNGMPTLEEPP